jgi:hypothetical protein
MGLEDCMPPKCSMAKEGLPRVRVAVNVSAQQFYRGNIVLTP